MADFKLTKQGLRTQQHALVQLRTYLPTLQLKKTMLQVEVNHTKNYINKLNEHLLEAKDEVLKFAKLLSIHFQRDPLTYCKVKHVEKSYENIAGVELPQFQKVVFEEQDYFLFDTPIWIDSAIQKIKIMIEIKEKTKVAEEKKRALEKELREVSIRVNLFDKVLIPRTEGNIKKIKIFLSDQELAAVSQAKVAKMKILEKRES